ncbi:hypothetical protein [Vibrio kanaloae]|uniref:hypothetical protein n=1 Tax=Vibrio kanaloae TaxID=170673 RepID=UPI0011157AD1|nr:hypothetical protein [Vibrio kanaloae]QPK05351.1 hypothetical protein BTD91_05330 [Vibrio kanaloae]
MAAIMGSRVASAGITFITSLLVMSSLDVVSFGEYFFLTTLVTFFSTLPNIGINNSFVFMGGEFCKKNSTVFLLTKVCISKVFIIAAVLVCYFFYFEDYNVILCVISGVFLSLFDSILSYFQSLKKFREYTILLPVKNISLLFIIFILLKSGFNPIYGFYIIALLSYLFFLYMTLTNLDLSEVSINSVINILNNSKYFIVFELMALIMIRTETWILKYYTSNEIIDENLLGVYGITLTICTAISILSNSTTSLLLPYIKENSKLLNSSNVTILMIVVSIFCLLYLYLTNITLHHLDPTKYSGYFSVAKYIIAGMALSFVAGVIRINLINTGFNQYLNKVYICQFIFSAICAFYMILYWGVVGAAISFFLTRLFGFVFTVLRYAKENYKNVSF